MDPPHDDEKKDHHRADSIIHLDKKKKKIKPRNYPGNTGTGETNYAIDSALSSSEQENSEITKRIILDATKALEELGRFGLDIASLKEFTMSLHRLAVASGVSPNVLSSIIKEINGLYDSKKLSLPQIRKHIQELQSSKDLLRGEIENLEKKKQSLEVDLKLKELEYSASTQTLSEYLGMKKELEKHGLSTTSVSKLIGLINKVTEELGSNYSSSTIVETLANLKSVQDRRGELESEVEALINSKRMLQDRLQSLEQEAAMKQKILDASDKLKKMGFEFEDLDKLGSMIRMIAQSRNTDQTLAKNRLLSDLEAFYADDHELRKRIRVLESLLEEKEEKFKMLGQDFQNEKAILDDAKELISTGFNKQWIEKLQTVLEAYGTNLDLLSEELKQKQGLKTSISELRKIKATLEEEERLIRQKVVAAEDQRIRTLSVIKDIMTNRSPSQGQSVAADSHTLHTIKEEIDWGLNELIKAAKGNESMDEDKFNLSLPKRHRYHHLQNT
jgi:DNA repair exonuclease SbcCD ATPase subunit